MNRKQKTKPISLNVDFRKDVADEGIIREFRYVADLLGIRCDQDPEAVVTAVLNAAKEGRVEIITGFETVEFGTAYRSLLPKEFPEFTDPNTRLRSHSLADHPTTEYDVVIVGSGICGMMAARELLKQRPELKIAIVDKGAVAGHSSSRAGGQPEWHLEQGGEALAEILGPENRSLYDWMLEGRAAMVDTLRDEIVRPADRRFRDLGRQPILQSERMIVVGAEPQHTLDILADTSHAGRQALSRIMSAKKLEKIGITEEMARGSGVLEEGSISVNPLLLMLSLYEDLKAAGVHFIDFAAAGSIDLEEGTVTVHDTSGDGDRAILKAPEIIIAGADPRNIDFVGAEAPKYKEQYVERGTIMARIQLTPEAVADWKERDPDGLLKTGNSTQDEFVYWTIEEVIEANGGKSYVLRIGAADLSPEQMDALRTEDYAISILENIIDTLDVFSPHILKNPNFLQIWTGKTYYLTSGVNAMGCVEGSKARCFYSGGHGGIGFILSAWSGITLAKAIFDTLVRSTVAAYQRCVDALADVDQSYRPVFAQCPAQPTNIAAAEHTDLMRARLMQIAQYAAKPTLTV